MTPVFVGILSFVYLKERLSLNKVTGIGLGLLGTVLLLLTNTITGFSFSGNYLGFFMIILGAILYSIYLVTTKNLQKKYSPIYITTVFNMATAFVAFFLAFGEFRTLPVWILGTSLKSLGVLLYVSILGTAVFYLLGQYIVKHASPVLSSIVQYVQVPFTIMWAYLLIGEKITPNFLLAAVLITAWAYLASK
jgi:drug/metabolite transporter (DMT)-like permease